MLADYRRKVAGKSSQSRLKMFYSAIALDTIHDLWHISWQEIKAALPNVCAFDKA